MKIYAAFAIFAIGISPLAHAASCCAGSGISYCDTSAQHFVCNNGEYSQCVCTRQGTYGLYRQFITGCCLWHGGVASQDLGEVICEDGSVSPVCSLQPVPLVEEEPAE